MNRKNFIFCVFLCVFGFPALSQVCNQKEKEEPVRFISTNNLNESWIVGGLDSSRVFRVDSGNIVQEKTDEIKRQLKGPYSCIITLEKDAAIIGSVENFAVVYDRGQVFKINSNNGLTDSCIVSIAFSRQTRRIYIETNRNSFVSVDSGFTRYMAITRYLRPERVNDSLLKEFHAGTMIGYVWLPARYATRMLAPVMAKKERQAIKMRKIKLWQRNEISRQLLPGDILLKRNDGDITNLVIPRFWTHTGIYVGDLKMLNEYFDSLPMLHGLKPSKFIKKHYPKVYRKLFKMKDPIIESVTKKGVSVAPLRNIATMDYFAALRPNLTKEDKFLSLLKAFDYYTLEYDYSFDLTQTNALVCSGLIYKSFLSTPVKKGIRFEISDLMGKPFFYPGDIVKKFDKECDNPGSELGFVLFYDSNDLHKKAFISTRDEFRKTWKR